MLATIISLIFALLFSGSFSNNTTTTVTPDVSSYLSTITSSSSATEYRSYVYKIDSAHTVQLDVQPDKVKLYMNGRQFAGFYYDSSRKSWQLDYFDPSATGGTYKVSSTMAMSSRSTTWQSFYYTLNNKNELEVDSKETEIRFYINGVIFLKMEYNASSKAWDVAFSNVMAFENYIC